MGTVRISSIYSLSAVLMVFALMVSDVASADQLMSLSRYELGSGDKIGISVFGEDDMEERADPYGCGNRFLPIFGGVSS